MNIPEMTLNMKQDVRSESVVPAQAVATPTRDAAVASRPDAVEKQSASMNEEQSESHSREELEAMVAEAQEELQARNVQLKFNIVGEDDTIQVEILDADGNTIRKIPEDELLKLTQSLQNLGNGFLDEVF